MILEFKGEYDFLSNFYEKSFTWDGRFWKTVEHAFQAAKTHSPEWKSLIQEADTPGEAKRIGRKMPLRPDWEEKKDSIMGEILFRKFAQNPDLAMKLIATKEERLQEGNRWGDKYWGVDLKSEEGMNKLGILLMATRRRVKEIYE